MNPFATELRIGAIRLTFIAFALALVAPTTAAADEPPRIRIGWSERVPELDGQIDPAEWAEAGHIEKLPQATPNPGVQATQRTEIWIMTDGKTLYIGAHINKLIF